MLKCHITINGVSFICCQYRRLAHNSITRDQTMRKIFSGILSCILLLTITALSFAGSDVGSGLKISEKDAAISDTVLTDMSLPNQNDIGVYRG